jgi:hypothetical protein
MLQIKIRHLAFVFILLLMCRMFKTWENIPALKGVSATMSLASSRLFPFAVIMTFLVTLFGGSAMLAFGQQMEEFHDFTTACISTLIVIFKGGSEIYQKQFQIDPFLSSVWHWLLVGLMTMVLLHLVFCILVESYAEAQAVAMAAKACSGIRPPTLFEQSIETMKTVSRMVCPDTTSKSGKTSLSPLDMTGIDGTGVVHVESTRIPQLRVEDSQGFTRTLSIDVIIEEADL